MPPGYHSTNAEVAVDRQSLMRETDLALKRLLLEVDGYDTHASRSLIELTVDGALRFASIEEMISTAHAVRAYVLRDTDNWRIFYVLVEAPGGTYTARQVRCDSEDYEVRFDTTLGLFEEHQ